MKHNWEYKRLGDVCEMKSGNFISADELSNDNSFPCFGGNGIRGYIERYSHDGHYCIIGRVGALCGNVHQFKGRFYATEHAIVASPILIQNVNWLYYQLSSMNLRKLAKGAAQPVISVGTLNTIKIPVPPMEVQEQIVAELDKINELIEAKREQLKLLDSLAQSLFYDMFGDPITNPKGWEIMSLKDICDKITDGTHDTPKRVDVGYKFITGKNIRTGEIDFDNTEFVDLETHRLIYSRCNPQKGDVLYTNIGANLATAAVNPVSFEFSMKNVALLKPHKKIIHGLFLQFVLNLLRSVIITSLSRGGAQKFLGLKNIETIKVPVPPLSLQEQFAAKVEAIEAQKATVEKSIAELQTLLDCRMDYWFN